MSNERMMRHDSYPPDSGARMLEPTDTGYLPVQRPVPLWDRTPTETPDQRAPDAVYADGDSYTGAGTLDPAPDVLAPADESSGLRLRSVLRETLETVLLALLIFVTVRAVIQNFKVEGSSMEPSLHSGQYLLVNKAAYLTLDLTPYAGSVPFLAEEDPPVFSPFGAPERGDVVVFRYPRDPRRDFIKRVIAVPGDTVEIRGGKVMVNNAPIDEPYIIENTAYSREAVIVPPDHFYVLGDNRNNSSDSHVWGPVPRENIIGKAWLSYWPFNDWGLAPNYPVAAVGDK